MNRRESLRFFVGGLALAVLLSVPLFTVSAENVREITLTAVGDTEESIWSPLEILAVKGETVKITLVNESEMMHGFNIKKFKVKEQVFGETEKVITFKAKKDGTFKFFCHFHKKHKPGQLIVTKQ